MKKQSLLMFGIITLAIALTACPANATPEQDTINALTALENHILANPTLTGPEIAAHKATIDTNKALFASSSSVMAAGLSMVETYDTQIGPLFVLGSPVQTIDRNTITDSDIEWSIWNVMQYLMDYTYTVSNVATYETTLDGKMFGSSAHFPGYVDPAAQRTTGYSVAINADYPDTVGWPRFMEGPGNFSRRPTGTYAAPGDIVTVTVPASMVNQGYRIRVGCHSWDFGSGSPGTPKNPVRRLDRVSLVYDITSTTTKVANPIGGGIYIEVPFDTSGNVETVQITNAVRSPFFSVNSITGNNTTVADWINIERNNPAPWADFQSEKFMMNVPTDWIYALNTPDVLMADWDLASDIYNDLMGFPYIQGRENFYMQVDLTIRGNAYYPGWPQCNVTYNPNTNYGGLSSNFLVTGPQYAPSQIFHEEGHGYLFPKLPGETESAVNIGHAAIWHQGFGYDLDYAFAASRGQQGNSSHTIDNAAVVWMTSFNFVNENPMSQAEKQYQLPGHAKFVELARMFGWSVVNDYFKSFVDYYEATGIAKPFNNDTDEHMLRLSIAADCDLRSFLYLWGIHPANPGTLAADIAAANLTEATADRNTVYDEIFKLSRMVPENNAEFQAFAQSWWGRVPLLTATDQAEREHAQQWDTYDESSHDAIVAVITNTLATYFPGGDPIPDSTPPTPDPMTWASVPVPVLTNSPLIYEPFDYPAGGLNGQGDTSDYGFSGLWNAQASALVDAGDLTYGTLPTIGGSIAGLTGGNNHFGGARTVSASALAANGLLDDGATLWFSVEMGYDTGGNVTNSRLCFAFANDSFSTGNYDYWIVDDGAQVGSGLGVMLGRLGSVNGKFAATQYRDLASGDGLAGMIYGNYSDVLLSGGQHTLIVGKITWGATSDTIEIYAPDTSLNLGPVISTLTVDVDQSAYDTITWSRGDKVVLDEIRFGSSLSQVFGQTGVSESEITMRATTATDDTFDVEYYFTCIAGPGNDSGWQDSTVYTDTGLASGTQYTYTVIARDKSVNQNTTAPSTAESATTGGTQETDPPTPNPATFATSPYAISDTAISMTATTGSDASGPVEYLFTETSGNPGGTSSGWQTSASYTDSGLTPETQYTYTVTMRDSLGNTGTASAPANATTQAAPDTTPPTPNPATFAVAPAADSDTAISMTATTGSDASGPVEYLFTETSGNPGGTSSGWQTSPSYTDSGLNASTQYTYTVKMRDSLGNTGTASSPASATTDPAATPPAAPGGLSANAISTTRIDISWTDNSGNETGFKIERSDRDNSNFVQIATVGADVTSFSDTTVRKGTSYYYRVRATNAGGDSAYSNQASATTPKK